MKIYDVRDGQKVVPTCPECGCRLHIKENKTMVSAVHYWGSKNEYDAAGCKCSLNFEIWVSIDGRKIIVPEFYHEIYNLTYMNT